MEPFHRVPACLEELDLIASGLHLDGVVWDHHAQGTAIDDQRMITFVRALAHHGLPALVHVHALDMREGPTHVESLARQVPEATIVALGTFSALQRYSELDRIARACPNLWFDTTVTIPIGPLDPMASANLAHGICQPVRDCFGRIAAAGVAVRAPSRVLSPWRSA